MQLYHHVCLSLLVLGLLLMALVAFGQEQPKLGGQIAYASTSGGQTNIYLMNADGTNQHLIIANGADPSFNPNGTKLVFTRGADIWTANADGSSQQRVTHHGVGVFVSTPVFSEDSNSIAFTMGPVVPNPVTNIQLVNVDGTNERTIAMNGTDPTYAPDGVRIGFARGGDLYTMSTNSMAGPAYTAMVLLQHGMGVTARYPHYSRGSNSLLAYTLSPVVANPVPAVHVYNLATRQDTVLVPNGEQAAFCPLGLYLVFVRAGDLYAIPSGGGSITRLTNSPGVDSHPTWAFVPG